MINLKYYLLASLLVFALSADAQKDSTKSGLKITRIELEGAYGSNHLTGRTAMPFVFSSAIDGDQLSKSSNLLFNHNRTGYQSYISTELESAKHKFSIGYYNNVGMSYSKNIYQLLFEGNAPHAGKKMDVKVHAKQLSYGKISYHLPWKTKLKEDKTNIVFRHHASLYAISKYGRAKTNGENYLFTSESGLDIEGQLNYNYQPNGTAGLKGAGIGFGTYAYARKDQKIKVLQISNLGFGVIGGDANQFYHDTSWTYSGVYFDLNKASTFDNINDSINGMLFKEEKSDTRIILLPVNISYEIQSPKANIGIQYMAMPGFLPQLNYLRKFYTQNNNSYGIGLQAGGWGLVNSVFKYNLFLKGESNRKLQLRVVGIESLALPYSTFGINLRLDI